MQSNSTSFTSAENCFTHRYRHGLTHRILDVRRPPWAETPKSCGKHRIVRFEVFDQPGFSSMA